MSPMVCLAANSYESSLASRAIHSSEAVEAVPEANQTLGVADRESRATTGGLVVVTAHPDDEVLIAGGTLAACAAAGVPTGVVCLTRGERGPVSDSVLVAGESLAEVRVKELREACTELHVSWVEPWSWGDGMLLSLDRAAIIDALAKLFQACQPDAVITFGADGLYGHPDHVAVYETVRQAAKASPVLPALYRSVWPKQLSHELVIELERRGLPADLFALGPEDFGVEHDASGAGFMLDVRRFARRKLRALRCHRTQMYPENAFTVLPDDLSERFLGYEWFAPIDVLSLNAESWLERTARTRQPIR